ncbi:MAG: cysteine--tRNA ligase [Spirochaetales bacterium]|jgi:cysteinyl-tRNA synthetase|nr:cysteine--tRNA ligase [Exilispira sp.]NMC66783.1 cysteine--tRNA ligase [Spirochaetales bacterium]
MISKFESIFNRKPELFLFNTMSQKKERFNPIEDNKARMYCCGLTVYNYAHIGNLRKYIFDDTLRRTLEFFEYNVTHQMNVTDIGHLESDADEGEDKLEKEAKKRGEDVLALARFYEKAFFDDLQKLNILMPHLITRATEHIDCMIDLIKRIEKNGYSYFSDGNLYFDVTKMKDYGKLARLDLSSLKAGARIEVDERKRSPYDFVLWFTNSKFKNHILNWESPWGEGFPGWHIECAAMSIKYLGEQFEIHTGGIDHIPVHHTNEIAEAEAATGKDWVKYWMHSEFLVLDKEEKMSKSLGNFITLNDIITKRINPLAYRFMCLNAHYRKKMIFSYKALESAQNGYWGLKEKVINEKEKCEAKEIEQKILENNYDINDFEIARFCKSHIEQFVTAISDDLNTPVAMSVIFNLLKDNSIPSRTKYATLLIFDRVLGLGFASFTRGQITEEQKKLIEEREVARKEKNFQKADQIRETLLSQGIVLQDTLDGTHYFLE